MKGLDLEDLCLVSCDQQGNIVKLNANATFVKADSHLVRVSAGCQGPGTFHAVVQSCLSAVGGALPDANGTVLTGTCNDGQFWVEHDRTNIVAVTVEGVYNRFCLSEREEVSVRVVSHEYGYICVRSQSHTW